jgi:predicted dehydrogenase
MPQTIRFSVIGMNHGHIYGQVNLLLEAGAEFVSFYAREPELLAEFAPRYPQARQANSIEEILEDETIDLVVSAAIPCERVPLGIRSAYPRIGSYDRIFFSVILNIFC